MTKKENLKDILLPLSSYLSKVDAIILEKLKTGIPILDDSATHLFKRGGKKVRASLVILTSALRGDIPNGTLEMAAAAEIVHAGTLVHDDIIDQALIRRGDVAVSKKYGEKAAVLAGDYMYIVALDTSIKDNTPGIFPIMVSGTGDMVRGELYQLQYSNIDSISYEHYYKIIELKTARFMAICTKLGAMKGDYSKEEIDNLYNFGLNLGYAFQIVDDTLDYMQTSDTTGKDIGNDFLDGKVTLPLLRLLEQCNQKEKEEYADYFRNPNEKNWKIVKDKLLLTDAYDFSLNIASDYIYKALENLKPFPDSDFKDILIQLAEFFLIRKF